MNPVYIDSFERGILAERAAEAAEKLSACDLCPRRCGVDRRAGERGVCRGGESAEISSAGPHYGEEAPLVGWGGSGTIFLTHCGLRCLFCQNYDISHGGIGRVVTAGELGEIMLELQGRGCHNINFVTPTHYLPQILAALLTAVPRGLQVPLVWNCGGYESVDALALLDGIVDIYMPDIKFSSSRPASEFSDAPDYFNRVKEAVLEMHRQVGDLDIGDEGVARRGLLVRHLVLPEGAAGTEEVARFLAGEVSTETYLNIMDQYRPCHEALGHPVLGRRTSAAEYDEAVQAARRFGLHRGMP